MSTSVNSSINNDQILINLLDRYKDDLLNNNLSPSQKLLLIELNIKDDIILTKKPLTNTDECLKYLFMGKYIYDHLPAIN